MHINNYTLNLLNFQNFRITFGVKISIFVIIRGGNEGREIPFDLYYVNIQLFMFNNFSIKFR
jgi:hypothetical protein